MSRGRHASRRFGRGAKAALIVACALSLTGGGVTLAAYRYDRATLDRVMPGIVIAGVDVGGMTKQEALAAVDAVAEQTLSRPIRITAAGHHWTSTPAELGMRAQVAQAVDEAMRVASTLGPASRVWHRLRDEPLGVQIDLTYKAGSKPVQEFVATAAAAVATKARDASLTVANGKVVVHHAKPGRALVIDIAAKRISGALSRGAASVALPSKAVQPKVSNKSLGRTIVVRRDVNRLYLYEGLHLDRTYPVATAAAGYVTPPGSWTIVDKQENPTWYNPAPTTWGADLPASIPPGPGNPLGTRALYLNSPGIRIHGTTDVGSIGTHASHGCIRMLISDIEELYPLIPIGTHVYVV